MARSRRRIGLNVPLVHGASLATNAGTRTGGTPHQIDVMRLTEDLGFSDLWSQEVDAHDAFTPLAMAAARTTRVRLGCAIAGIFTRGPALLAMQAASLADAAPGRSVVGLGTSSAPIVEGWNGLDFEAPLTRMRRTLDFLDEVFETGRAEVTGAALGSRGFELGFVPAARPEIFVAALGPKMMDLAATRAHGVILSLVTPEHVRRLVDRFRASEAGQRVGDGGSADTRGEVVLRIGCLLAGDRTAAREHARRTLAAYLCVPTYAALYTALGERERLEPILHHARAGRHGEARRAVPDEWVEGVFAIGTASEIAERLARFRAAGVDTPIIAPTAFGADVATALEVWASA